MAAIIGHSQVKYIHNYLNSDNIFTLCYPGITIEGLTNKDEVFDLITDVSVSLVFTLRRCTRKWLRSYKIKMVQTCIAKMKFSLIFLNIK
jgi:hypothetical protein